MRAAIIAVALAACSSSPAPKPPASPPPKCAKVADHMLELMTPDAQRAPSDELDAMRKVISDHCRNDRWSAAAQDCVLAAASRRDLAERCGDLFTADQAKALVGEAQSWPSDAAPSDAGAVDGP